MPKANIQLPNELLSAIINSLAAEYNDTTQAALASCRLASHVLCSLATPLFFSSLQLRYHWGLRGPVVSFLGQGRNLVKLLSIHDIAALVHTFTLRCGPETFQISKAGPLICEILHRLRHLRNFTFKFRWTTLAFPFDSFQSNISSAIEALCKSPNLTTLDLSNIMRFPLRFITACPNLRCLRLTGVYLEVIWLFHSSYNIANLISRLTTIKWMKHQACGLPTWTPWRLWILALLCIFPSDSSLRAPTYDVYVLQAFIFIMK